MKLSVSNIGWNISDDKKVSSLLKKYKIKNIDIAPTKYFKDPSKTTFKDISKVKEWWNNEGIKIFGMQSLMFGTNGLNLFGNRIVQNKMLNHLDSICRIGSVLNAKKLVFGSPKNRDRSKINNQDSKNIAIDFFNRLGIIAKSKNIIICLEPNPESYGANFMTTTFETAKIVKSINHPSIKMQLDIGAISINKENILLILEKYSELVGHIHLSEPNLETLKNKKYHNKIHQILNKFFPKSIITIETLAKKNNDYLKELEKSLMIASEIYL